MFRTVEEVVGPIEVCVFNVGGNVKFPLEETTSRVYYKVCEIAFIFAQRSCLCRIICRLSGFVFRRSQLLGVINFGALRCARGPQVAPNRSWQHIISYHGAFEWVRELKITQNDQIYDFLAL